MLSTVPNPFTSNTIITIIIEIPEEASLIVYDPMGREVAVLSNEFLNADTYSFILEGKQLKAGMYVCKFTHNGKVTSTTIAKQYFYLLKQPFIEAAIFFILLQLQ